MVETGRKETAKELFGDGFYLQRIGRMVYLYAKDGGRLATCKMKSVAGRDFKKILKERTGLDEETIDRWVADFQFKQQTKQSSRANFDDSKEEKVSFDDETIEKASLLVRDPLFFWLLGKVFNQGFIVSKLNKPRFVLGEHRNKRLAGLLLIGAAKLNMTSMIKLLGDPGTAKDTMLRMWLDILPIKSIERSYFTAAALRYSQSMKNADLLYIPDSPELRGEMGRQLRFMRSDDGGLISEYATKDNETGEMTTKLVELPIKAVATTSNSITGDPALESGMWTLTTNGTPDLTTKVKVAKLELRANKRGVIAGNALEVWRCAFHILLTEDLPDKLPHIPYANSLVGLLTSKRSESRRDPDRLCDLISLVAWLRRFQKNNGADVADVADLYIALQLGLDAISSTISELNTKEQKIFNVVSEKESCSCRDVTDDTKIPYKTCYRILEKLIEKGYVNKDKVSGKNFYSVLTENTPNAFLNSEGRNVESADEEIKGILESFEGFSLSHGDREVSFFDPVNGKEIKISVEEDGKLTVVATTTAAANLEKYNALYPHEKVRRSERSIERVSEQENKPKTFLPSPMRSGKVSKTKNIIEESFFENKPRTCPICGNDMPLSQLSNIDGKPACKSCVKKLEASH